MGGGCNLVAHTASRQEAADRLICAARRRQTTRHVRAAPMQPKCQRASGTRAGATGQAAETKQRGRAPGRRGPGRGDHADRRCMPLVLSAPCPGGMGSPHGPRRWRRPPCPSRSTSRARPGTRPRAALFVVTSYTVRFDTSQYFTPARRVPRRTRYGLGSARHSEVAGAPLAHTNENHNLIIIIGRIRNRRASRPRQPPRSRHAKTRSA